MDNEFVAQIVYEAIQEVSTFASEMLESPYDRSFLEKDFVDLGINSIDYTHLLSIVMEKLKISFSADRFLTSPNVGQCVDTLAGLREGSLQP